MGVRDRPAIHWTYDAAAAEPDGAVGSARPEVVEAADGTLLVAGDRALSAVDPATGNRFWAETFEKRVAIEGTTSNAAIVSEGSRDVLGEDPVTLVAVSLESGTRVWDLCADLSDTVVDDRTLFYRTDDSVTAVDSSTWNRLWRTTVSDANALAPDLLAHGLLGVGTVDTDTGGLVAPGAFAALDTTTGTRQWRSTDVDPRVGVNPYTGSDDPAWQILTDEVAVTSSRDRSLVALDTTDGTLQWRFTPDRTLPVVRPLAANDDYAVVGTFQATVVAQSVTFDSAPDAVHLVSLDTQTCEWHYETGSYEPGTGAALLGGTVLIYDHGTIEALTLSTGTQKWEFETSGTFSTRETVSHVDDKFLTVCQGGTVYLVSSETGEPLWTFAGGNSSVEALQTADRLIVANHDSGDGVIYALDWSAGVDTNHRTRVYSG
ncbi:PQQ-binding-like beta-propeller repeat protein [Halobellus ordinarius]|uniref:outer membrane protein assembly factor BamB family protein n=1 Tax=Halobellus ordinarius TaxID=3075120 RepID=UPI00287FF619|nr:PQQ-binding-like beta-propeller repeat protein [Halobellus sp. ZY16]